jgi:hypothetical protein
MTQHTCTTFNASCYRCDLSRDEIDNHVHMWIAQTEKTVDEVLYVDVECECGATTTLEFYDV